METMESNLRVLAENQALEEAEFRRSLAESASRRIWKKRPPLPTSSSECIVENLAVKQDYFARLDALCGESTILATNTHLPSA